MKYKLLFICLFACLFVLAVPGGAAQGGSVTDTISIHIGYFGWDEEQFVEKVTYHWRELDDLYGGILSTDEVVYSYFSGRRTYLAAGRGFYIRDLLDYAGIDFGSISRIDFFTRDQTVGPYRSFTKASLFDMPRYYFPYLAADEDTGEIYSYHGGDLYDGATRVDPMLALEDYTEWDSVGVLFSELYESTMFSAINRFRLFFGQLSPSEANTSSSAKYVYKLFITFTGTPVLSTDETNIELRVGNSFQMIVNVSAEDALLDRYVSENLIWTSDDESVISVDAHGNLTVKAEGDAVITASFGQASVSAAVRVGQNETVQIASETGAGGGTGTGSGSVAGDGDGDEDGAGVGDDNDIPYEPIANVGIHPREDAELQFIENAGSVYILSRELMSMAENAAWVSRVLGRDYTGHSEGAVSGSRGGGMGADAVQLILPLREHRSYIWVVTTAFAAFFAFGFGYGMLSFRKKL